MTDYTLWHGDCLEEMNRIEDGSIDAIICDLPYNVTNCHWDTLIPFEPLWAQYKRVIKKRGAVVLFGSQPFTSLLVMSNLEWFVDEWIWRKSKPSGFLNAKKHPLKRHESIIIFSPDIPSYSPQLTKKPDELKKNFRPSTMISHKEKFTPYYSTTYNRVISKVKKRTIPIDMSYPDTVLDIQSPHKNEYGLHPTQKPVALLSYLIKTYTNEGETVLDNTFGSCSTGEAAIRTNRRFIGIEKDLNYFEIGKARLERVAAELRGELNHLPMFAEGLT